MAQQSSLAGRSAAEALLNQHSIDRIWRRDVSVWTADPDRGIDIARRVRAGTYGVNQYTMDFVAPFGGFKGSGIGREFGKEGLEEYTELKSIIPAGGGVAAAG